jgi:PAS domain S-box-containing protein
LESETLVPDNPKISRAPESAEVLELLIDSSTDFAVFSTDENGLVLTWNIGAERLFGYADSEIVSKTADILFTQEDRAAGVPDGERTQARAHGRAQDERWHLRKDGARFWASGTMMPFRGGRPGFVKIARDRTKEHAAVEQLKENEERFRILATSIPQLVFRTRPDGDRTWGSPQWIEFTGLSLEDSLGFGWLDAIHPEDLEATQAGWSEAQKKGEYYVEHRVRRKADGEYRWHQTRAKPLEGNSPPEFDWVGTMTDIHDLRGLQARQQLLMAELQHRTRNLLAVVQSVANQTARSSTSIQSFAAEFVSRLRALSRVQSLIARVDAQVIDLRELVTAELTAHGKDAVQSGKIIVSGPSVQLPTAAAQALGLALHELATNAVKYGALAQANGKLHVAWSVVTEGTEPKVNLEWRETGVEMPATKPERKDYGSELIERALPYQLNAKTTLEFAPDGVRCAIIVPVQSGQMEAVP